MEKFIKIFTTDRRKNTRYVENEDDRDFTPPLDGRRQLSISRSGRMKQANRKRHSLSMDLYGENVQSIEKSKNVEFHVNPQTKQTTLTESKKADVTRRRNSVDTTSPEEEIDIAFQIIDKT